MSIALNFLLRNCKIARFFLAIFLSSCTTIPEDIFLKNYKPIFAKQGINFRIDYKHFSQRENILVYKDGSEWTITIYQGFLVHPAINKNGLKIAVCHEVGHLLAERGKNDLYASERVSDAYAIFTCSKVLKMNKEEILDGINSIYNWYNLYPLLDKDKYPSAQERRDIMLSAFSEIN